MTSIVEEINAAGRELQELEQRMANREADRAAVLRAKWHKADLQGTNQTTYLADCGIFSEAITEISNKDDGTLYALMCSNPQQFGVKLAGLIKEYAEDVSLAAVSKG